jgi:uncharacterized SAM-binding protein YcdF (DUF218 family)
MQFIVRTLESLLYPVGFVWIWLTVCSVMLWWKKLRGGAGACAFASIFLYVTGATPLPEFLIARLERPYVNANVADATAADVVIVLGGNLNPSAHDTFKISLNSSADRIVTGVELIRERKAPAVILGGGSAKIGPQDVSEGKRVEAWLKTWNIAQGEIIGLPTSVNTHEEALHSRDVMAAHHWTNAILVTSAFHMRRALATFHKAGIAARPLACDFEGLPVVEGDMPRFRLVPVGDHLKTLALYVHEVIGWYYYAARGWI